jgi:Na+-transporting methylmalonyl-CoA/oxaloacetate decarboxylase gamma subunit
LPEAAVLQFGVTLVVLAVVLVLLWLVLQRVGGIERRFEGLARSEELQQVARAVEAAAESAATDARFHPLEEGVRRLGDAIARLPVPLEAKELVPLQERLELLARAIDELRHHVDELRSRDPQASVDVAPGANVLRALQQRGFESIRIVGGVADEETSDAGRVPVEARRAGMSFKGWVTLENGRVGDISLKPVTEVFP